MSTVLAPIDHQNPDHTLDLVRAILDAWITTEMVYPGRRSARFHDVIPELSPREEEIVVMAADGLTDAAMARALGISEGTVGTYWSRIRGKIGPYSRTELVAVRIRNQLQVKFKELEAERQSMSFELQTSRTETLLYEGVLDSSEEGVIVINADGEIIHANPSAHRIFGYADGELGGVQLLELIPHRFRDKHLTRLAEFVRNPMNGHLHPHVVIPGLHLSGEEIRLEQVMSAVRLDADVLVASFFHPHEPDIVKDPTV